MDDIWDKLCNLGVTPCSFTALDKVRIEAALLFYGYDMTEDHSRWKVGLGFCVNLNKPDFRGKAAAVASQHETKFSGVGLSIDHNQALVGG